MNIVYIYARDTDGVIRRVDVNNSFGAPEAGTTRVARFDTAAYPQYYNVISGMVQYVRFVEGALVLEHPILGTSTIATAQWIADREAEILAIEADDTADVNGRADLLAQAANALTQIASDRTVIAGSNIPAPVKAVMDNMLVREDRIIRALRAVIRSGLDGG
jgi:hypothetical protein